jgi:hypothetical protein
MERLDYKKMMNIWKEYFNKFCIFNDDIAETIFYQLCGVKMKKVKFQYGGEPISLRLSSFVIQPSGTGKGQAIKPMKMLCEQIDVSTIILTESTDAGLVGTIIPIKKKNDGLDDKDNIIFGALGDKQIIVFNEGEALLKSGADFNRNIYQILQNACDDPGHVSKRMALGLIEYDTESILMISSYFEKDFNHSLLNKGLLQRVLLIVKNFSEEQVKQINAFLAKSTIKKLEGVGIPQELVDFFSNISQIEETIFCEIEASNHFICRFEEIFDSKLTKIHADKKELLYSFLTRWNKAVFKFAAILAVLNGRNKITSQDVDEAFDICDKYITGAINLIIKLHKPEEDTAFEAIVKFLEHQQEKKFDKGKEQMGKLICKNPKLEKIGINKMWDYIDLAVGRKIICKENSKNVPNKYIFFLPKEKTAD